MANNNTTPAFIISYDVHSGSQGNEAFQLHRDRRFLPQTAATVDRGRTLARIFDMGVFMCDESGHMSHYCYPGGYEVKSY